MSITVLTAGDDHSDEIDQIRQEIRDLDPEADDYDDRLADLREELKNLRSLPSIPRKVEYKPSGKTIGEVWQSLDTAGKRRFLQDAGVNFHVSRDADRNVSVVIGPDVDRLEGGELPAWLERLLLAGRPEAPGADEPAALPAEVR